MLTNEKYKRLIIFRALNSRKAGYPFDSNFRRYLRVRQAFYRIWCYRNVEFTRWRGRAEGHDGIVRNREKREAK